MIARFDEVAITGTRRWKTSEGKRCQESKKFFQTLNPWNRAEDGQPKTPDQIMKELIAERAKWLAEGDSNG